MEHLFKGMPPTPSLRAAWQKALEGQQQGILRSTQLSRKQREILVRSGRLKAIMRGWYQLQTESRVDTGQPDLAAFLPLYLEERLGSHWCLSAASSLAVRCGDGALPPHVVVQSLYGSTTVHTFGDGTRLTVYQEENQLPTRLETIRGLRVMSPETILARLTASQWRDSLAHVDQLLDEIGNFEGFVWHGLNEGRHQALQRLLERLRVLGREEDSRIVMAGLESAGLSVPQAAESVPRAEKEQEEALDTESKESPVAEEKGTTREPPLPSTLGECWDYWSRQIPSARFRANNLPGNLLHRLAAIENGLQDDAQHHLRLAGYELPTAAVEAIFMEPERAAEAAGWPLLEEIQHRLKRSDSPPLPGEVDPAALVALQGYAEALKLVKRSVVRMLEGRSLETILRQDMRGWRLALMSPSAEAGLIPHRQILRYREREDRQRMDSWMKMVAQEQEVGKRGVLAFLALSHLAPWETGNRRMALLVLNALNTAAGLPWMVVRRTEEFEVAWVQALEPSSPQRVVDILADSTLV